MTKALGSILRPLSPGMAAVMSEARPKEVAGPRPFDLQSESASMRPQATPGAKQSLRP